MLQHQLEIIRKSREGFIYICKNLSMDQMNLIPQGFNNNIIWNFGHTIAVQQSLCYGLSGLPLKIDLSLYNKYKKGSKPESYVSLEEYQELQNLSISLINELENDLNNNVFQNYSPYMTSLNVELDNIEKAVTFNAFHEGLHFGYMMALKRVVKNS